MPFPDVEVDVECNEPPALPVEIMLSRRLPVSDTTPSASRGLLTDVDAEWSEDVPSLSSVSSAIDWRFDVALFLLGFSIILDARRRRPPKKLGIVMNLFSIPTMSTNTENFEQIRM